MTKADYDFKEHVDQAIDVLARQIEDHQDRCGIAGTACLDLAITRLHEAKKMIHEWQLARTRDLRPKALSARRA